MAKKDEFATALLICLTEKLIDTYGKKEVIITDAHIKLAKNKYVECQKDCENEVYALTVKRFSEDKKE